MALVAFPIVLPQLAVLITGHGPGSPEFQAKQAGFLRELAERLA